MSDYNDFNQEKENFEDPLLKGMTVEEQDEILGMSALAKVGNVIVAPTKAFKALKYKPNVIVPMLAVIVLPMLYYLIFWQSYEIQLIQLLENQFASMGIELTREMLELQLKISRWTTTLGPLIIPATLLLPGVLYFAIGKIIKTDVTFKRAYAMVLHASLISSLLWIFHMIVTLAMGESNIFAPMSSAASLLPADQFGTVMYAILSSVEIFAIWYYIILFLGLSLTCGYSKKAAGITVAGTVVISTLIAVGSVLATGLAGGM